LGQQEEAKSGFEVSTWMHVLGGWVTRHPGWWIRMGNWETRLLKDRLEGVTVDRPVYIAGLARAGSTLLLELLDEHPDTAAHRYRDFPLLEVPYFWNRFLDNASRDPGRPVERTHRDGIRITPESPEAFEEVLWMAFFHQLHDPAVSAVLDGETANPGFEAFYRDHIRKLLLVRGGARYLSKGNYNVTRLEYLHKQFEDARFLIPVREPVWHIASLMKQHRLFCAGERDNPRALQHLQQVGHFEFGEDRRPINAGDRDEVEQVRKLWAQGAEVEGWARYWAHIHGYLADRLAASPELAEAALVVRYEDLCAGPVENLRRILEHCGLPVPAGLLEEAAQRVRFPGYYRPRFSDRELETIRSCTESVAARFGLGSYETAPPVARAAGGST